jgi:hypothetical protein
MIAIKSKAKPTPTSQHINRKADLIDPEDISRRATARMIASMKSNFILNELGCHASRDFENTICKLKELNVKSKEIRVIEKVGKVHFTEMKKKNKLPFCSLQQEHYRIKQRNHLQQGEHGRLLEVHLQYRAL